MVYFSFKILINTQAARQKLTYIEERHEDILTLENSIEELRDMFLDMKNFIESQVRVFNFF